MNLLFAIFPVIIILLTDSLLANYSDIFSQYQSVDIGKANQHLGYCLHTREGKNDLLGIDKVKNTFTCREYIYNYNTEPR